MLDYLVTKVFFFTCMYSRMNKQLLIQVKWEQSAHNIALKSKLLGMSALKLFTVANAHDHLSW